jgi:hypothetical protein
LANQGAWRKLLNWVAHSLEVDFAKGAVFDFVFSLFDRHDHQPLLLVHDKLLRIGVCWPVSLLSGKAMITNAQGNQR